MPRHVTLLGPDGQPVDRGLLRREVSAPTLMSVRQPIQGHPA